MMVMILYVLYDMSFTENWTITIHLSCQFSRILTEQVFSEGYWVITVKSSHEFSRITRLC